MGPQTSRRSPCNLGVPTLTQSLGSSMPLRGPRATCPCYLGAQATEPTVTRTDFEAHFQAAEMTLLRSLLMEEAPCASRKRSPQEQGPRKQRGGDWRQLLGLGPTLPCPEREQSGQATAASQSTLVVTGGVCRVIPAQTPGDLRPGPLQPRPPHCLWVRTATAQQPPPSSPRNLDTLWGTGGSCVSPRVLARPPPALGVPPGPCCSGQPHLTDDPVAQSGAQPLASRCGPWGASPSSACLPRAAFAKCEISAPRASA